MTFEITEYIYLTDFIPEFKRIKESLDNYNLVIIVGDEGTGKTGFVNNYFSNFNNFLINRVDSNTPKFQILSYLRNKNIFYKKKVLIYDDITIKSDLLTEISKYIHPTRSDKKVVVIVNKLKWNPIKYIIHNTRYPTKQEVFRYINGYMFNMVRREHQEPFENPEQLRKDILKMDIYNMRRIQFALEDGFLTQEIKTDEKKFNITKMNPYMISFYMAENLSNLRRIKDNIIDADKLKYVNDHFYLDFIKLHYPNIDKKRLRYPKQLLEIIKKGKKE